MIPVMTDEEVRAEEKKRGPGIVGVIRFTRDRVLALEKKTAELDEEVRRLKSESKKQG